MTDVSCVYCIKHKLDTEWENIYIGSTCSLRDRIGKHKYCCYRDIRPEYNYKVYKYIRENGDWDNFEVLVLEECEVEKLKRLEQSYMDVYKPTLNSVYALGRDKERSKRNRKNYHKVWSENNKCKLDEYKKEWYENNKKRLLERAKEKFECECGSILTRQCKARHLKSKKHQDYLLNKK